MDEMNRVSDYMDVFLRGIYSENEGWTCSELREIGEYTPDYIFELDDDKFSQIVVRVPDSVINVNHIISAKRLLAFFKAEFPNQEAKLLLACGKLLVNPPELPENILAISIFEETFGNHLLGQWEHSLN